MKMLLLHAEPVISTGKDMQLYRFASCMPSFIESRSGDRRDKYVIIGDGKEERRLASSGQ